MTSSITVVSKVPVVQFLIEYMISCAEKNEIATYEGMEQATGADCKIRRHNLYRAIDTLRERCGLVFRNVPGIGYKCLGNGEVSDSASSIGMSKVGVAINRWRSEMQTVKIGALNQSEQLSYSLSALKLSLMEEALQATNKPELERTASMRSLAQSADDVRSTRSILNRLVS